MASLTRLNEIGENAVIDHPETGMGFQLFELESGSYALVIASLISVYFQERYELFELLPRANRLLTIENGTQPPNTATHAETDGRREWGRLLTRREYITNYLLHAGVWFPWLPPQPPHTAVELFHEMPGGQPQLFVRYYARVRDPRIRADGRVDKETYFTTYNDIRMVPSGLAAVGRYALPAPASAQFMFPVMSNAPYRMGTALPHFGQSGGGVEVYFEDEFKTLVAEPHQIPIG